MSILFSFPKITGNIITFWGILFLVSRKSILRVQTDLDIFATVKY